MSIFFTRTFDKADGGKIEIQIGAPEQERDGNGDWMCFYRIDGIGDGRQKTSMGVDAIQAMFLAMTYMSTSLYCSKEYVEGAFRWEGEMSPGDLGLPISDVIRDEVRSKMEALASTRTS